MKSTLLFGTACVTLLMLVGCVSLGPTSKETPPETTAVAAPKLPVCAGQPPRKVLVTAFPLRYPEQLRPGEFTGWAQVTGEELFRNLVAGKRVQAVSASQRFPFELADKAPDLEQEGAIPSIVRWAEKDSAQYVLAGVFHDFGNSKQAYVVPERQLQLEAFLYDAADGRLIAREHFSRALLLGSVPRSVAPGTQEFARSRLGKTYNGLLAEVTRWAEDVVACQPFAVRIAAVEGRRITLELGSERGITPGMTLQAWRPGNTPPPRKPGELVTAKPLPTALVKDVGPNRSIAEIPQQRFPPSLKAGDILYIPDPAEPRTP